MRQNSTINILRGELAAKEDEVEELKTKLVFTELALAEASKATVVTTSASTVDFIGGEQEVEVGSYESPHVERMDAQGNIHKYYYERWTLPTGCLMHNPQC